MEPAIGTIQELLSATSVMISRLSALHTCLETGNLLPILRFCPQDTVDDFFPELLAMKREEEKLIEKIEWRRPNTNLSAFDEDDDLVDYLQDVEIYLEEQN